MILNSLFYDYQFKCIELNSLNDVKICLSCIRKKIPHFFKISENTKKTLRHDRERIVNKVNDVLKMLNFLMVLDTVN